VAIAGAIGVDLIEIKPKSTQIKSRRVCRVMKIKVVCSGWEWYGLDELDERIPTLQSLGQSELI
jgi:hypothetical protein